jgi:hypothetical protein
MADPQQPPYPTPPPDSIIFDSFEGLKNTVTPERLKPTELWVGKNIDLDDAGQARRRRGFRKASNGSWHSLYSDPSGLVVGVKDDVLGIVRPDWSHDPLLPNVGDEPLDFVRVGSDLYFSSLLTSGRLNAPTGQVFPWGQIGGDSQWVSPVVHPTPTLGPVRGRLLGKPPMANCLTYYNGRIYMGCGRLLWATDLWLYNLVDKTRTFFQFESDITMLDTVADGVYVGTESGVYFLSGNSMAEMKRITLMSYGVLPHSSVQVPAELIKPQIQQDPQSPIKNAVMFLTDTGVVAGFDGGVIYNLTQADFLFPLAVSAATMFRRQDGINQFVAVVNSDGTPSESARMGEYVDVEIRRWQGV